MCTDCFNLSVKVQRLRGIIEQEETENMKHLQIIDSLYYALSAVLDSLPNTSEETGSISHAINTIKKVKDHYYTV